MNASTQEVVRGAAMVIDDRIEQSEDAIQLILDQLEAAEVPTVRLKALPSPESLIHWKQFGLIVMDWDLSYGTADDETPVPAGVVVPTELASDMVENNIEFVRSLIRETALPIFVATNSDVDSIRSDLNSAFSGDCSVLEERVNVFSKGELEFELFEKIGKWIAARPALKALNAWKRAYVEAEIAVFHQFSEAEEDWIGSIQRAALADGASFPATLRDLLARNILNRIGPLEIEMSGPAEGLLTDAGALRRVLHMSAVIPETALASYEPCTGDLFVADNAAEPFNEILILLTPECDLTAREPKWRFTYLPATRSVSSKPSKKRVDLVANPQRGQLATNLLTPSGDEYLISLRQWESIWVPAASQALDSGMPGSSPPLWNGHRRIGRLIDPYVTHLQQNFALATIRKGLPRLPEDFYQGWTEPDETIPGESGVVPR